MIPKLLVIAAVIACLCVAESPVATVSTGGPLIINGTEVPTAGISSWPLAAGDVVTTTEAPALIVFNDGSRLTLGRESKAKLGGPGRLGMNVLSGTVLCDAANSSKLVLNALGRPVALQSTGENVIQIAEGNKVSVRAKDKHDEDDFSHKKPKKPHPRSPHGKGPEN